MTNFWKEGGNASLPQGGWTPLARIMCYVRFFHWLLNGLMIYGQDPTNTNCLKEMRWS